MKRLTKYTDHGVGIREDLEIHVMTARDFDRLQYVLSVLAAYEDLGVTPEQVRQMDTEFARVSEELGRY